MKVLNEHTKFALLGKPGSIFSKGFQRRLDIITKLVDFRDKKILDLGCGEGVWLGQFVKFTKPENVFGSEFDIEQVEQILNSNSEILNKYKIPKSNIKTCPGEKLDFPDNFFDIVFQNEVLEHVQDDQQTLNECLRVLKPGGYLVFFTPNRGWPFEQHGMFIGHKYYWGNIPLLPWMPKFIRKKFAPHVRNYSNREIDRLVELSAVTRQPSAQNPTPSTRNSKLITHNPQPETRDPKLKTIYHIHLFPGFDGAIRKLGFIGKIIQKFFFLIEKTPLHFFGISHLVIAKKTNNN